MESKGFKKKRKRRDLSSTSLLEEKVWEQFSLYIRMRDADWKGYVKCVTCGAYKFWRLVDAGHFIPGRKNIILFDERQVHGQCKRCNGTRKGNWDKYYVFMKNKYGQEVIDELLELNSQIKVWTTIELKEKLHYYKSKVGSLKQRIPQTSY
jgi:hypothetical protein